MSSLFAHSAKGVATQCPLPQRLGSRGFKVLEGQTSALRHILKVFWRPNAERVMLGKMTKLIYRAIHRVVWSQRRENKVSMVMASVEEGEFFSWSRASSPI